MGGKWGITHEGNGAGRSRPVLALLAIEEETLAGLACPGGQMVVLQQSGGLLGVDGLRAEPEEFLGVDEVPGMVVSDVEDDLDTTVLPTLGSCCPCARVGRPRLAQPPSSPPPRWWPRQRWPQQPGSRWQSRWQPRSLQVGCESKGHG